jgi:hypothetical protein
MLMVVMLLGAMAGCKPTSGKAKIIHDGIESVDQHAKDIQREAKSQD